MSLNVVVTEFTRVNVNRVFVWYTVKCLVVRVFRPSVVTLIVLVYIHVRVLTCAMW